MTSIREATFALLRRHGMTTMFGNPGSNELLFLADFPEDFDYILGLHEGAVLAMADGFAQVSGRAPLVSLHSAAGTGTSMGVLVNTVQAKSPVVMLAGQQVRDMVGQDIMVASEDARTLPKPLTKYSAEPLSPTDVVRSMAQAIHTANQHPKGPTHVSVPYDDWDQEIDENVPLTLARELADGTAISEAALSALVARIDGARNVALVLGPEVDATHANADAVRLADRIGADAWIAPSPPRCPFPTTHARFRGVLPANVRDIASLLSPYDLVVVIGAPVFRYHHNHPARYLAEGTELVQISQDAEEIARAAFGDAVLAPVADTVARLAAAVTPQNRPAPDAPARSTGSDRAEEMHPDTVFRLIAELAPKDAIHVVESTSTAQSFWSNVPMSEQGSFFSAAAGGLGFGLPAAVGIQLAAPERRVVAAIGDGSANFGITGLWSAARYDVPVVFVVLRNRTYGALESFSRRLNADAIPGVELPGIDFVRIAEGYGVAAESATDEAELRDALTRAFASTRPVLIEAHTYHA